MSKILLQPTYFPTIESFQLLYNHDTVIFEIQEHFQKQTYRTRCNISTSNGIYAMNIPIKHQKSIHQFTKEVKIENEFAWQKNHFKTLQNAYRSSPFFEFYEAEFELFYTKKEIYLLDFVLNSIELIFKLLQTRIEYQKTNVFEKEYQSLLDYRFLVNAKTTRQNNFKPYTQVFQNKYDFFPNLSIIDLLFNEGPNSFEYLK